VADVLASLILRRAPTATPVDSRGPDPVVPAPASRPPVRAGAGLGLRADAARPGPHSGNHSGEPLGEPLGEHSYAVDAARAAFSNRFLSRRMPDARMSPARHL